MALGQLDRVRRSHRRPHGLQNGLRQPRNNAHKYSNRGRFQEDDSARSHLSNRHIYEAHKTNGSAALSGNMRAQKNYLDNDEGRSRGGNEQLVQTSRGLNAQVLQGGEARQKTKTKTKRRSLGSRSYSRVQLPRECSAKVFVPALLWALILTQKRFTVAHASHQACCDTWYLAGIPFRRHETRRGDSAPGRPE